MIPAIAANPPALWNMQFNANGDMAPYNPGIYGGAGFSVSPDNVSSLQFSNLQDPVKRYSLYSHADFDVTPNIKAYVEGSYGYVYGSNLSAAEQATSIGIKRDNAYAPAALKAFFAANPSVQRITIGRMTDDLGGLYGQSTARTWQVTGGLNGRLGDDWTWNAAYSHGENHRVQSVSNDTINTNFWGSTTSTTSLNYHAGGAIDAVQPGGPGTPIVCRSTVDPTDPDYNPNNGCVPVDLFGIGKSSPAAIAYVNGVDVEHMAFTQDTASFGVQGKFMHTWAGPIGLAGGLDYRKNTISVLHGPIGNAFGYYYNYGSDYAGSVQVLEGYAEADVPLAKDLPLAKSIDLDLAGRRTHYHNVNDLTGATSSFGVSSWKISLVYDVTDWLRLRATRSRDIRAADFYELYVKGSSAFGGLINPWTFATDFPTYNSGGNVNLKPETGDTYTLGTVLQPHWGWLDGLRLSADYYHIALRGAIGSLSASALVTDCTPTPDGGLLLADHLPQRLRHHDHPGRPEQREPQSLEIQRDRLRGAYVLPLDRFSAGAEGDLNFHVLATYALHETTTAGTYFIDRAGMTGPFAGYGQVGTPGTPRFVLDATATYERGPLGLTVQGHYISPGKFDASLIGPDDPNYNVSLSNSINDNTVAGRFYVNLSARYDILTTSRGKAGGVRDHLQPVRHPPAAGPRLRRLLRAGVLRPDRPDLQGRAEVRLLTAGFPATGASDRPAGSPPGRRHLRKRSGDEGRRPA
ncbi:MAG: TonB-dependent receptor [Caulobacteraceae bacterium]